jgi:hypothetical protein
VENIRETQAIEQAQYLGRIGPRHLVGIGDRALQDHRPGRSQNYDDNEQNDPGLNCA